MLLLNRHLETGAGSAQIDIFGPRPAMVATPPPVASPIGEARGPGVDYIGQHIYIRPHMVVSIPEYSFGHTYTSQAFLENKKNLADNRSGGIISDKADKNIRAAVNWLVMAAEQKRVFRKSTNSWFNFKINFITLTLPDTFEPVKAEAFKKALLNPFLTYARKYWKMRNYIWKVEYQKNGKLHLHLTTDTFIHHARIRKQWNKLLGANGYLTKFYRDHGHSNPNSTDIHSVRKIRNIAAYIAKYMAKNDQAQEKEVGKIWSCNQELSKALKTRAFFWPTDTGTGIASLYAGTIKKQEVTRRDPKTGLFKKACDVFYPRANHWAEVIRGKIRETFEATIMALRDVAHDGTFFPEFHVVD